MAREKGSKLDQQLSLRKNSFGGGKTAVGASAAGVSASPPPQRQQAPIPLAPIIPQTPLSSSSLDDEGTPPPPKRLGRPRLDNTPHAVSIRLSDDDLAAISSVQFNNHLPSLAATIRFIIRTYQPPS